MKRIWRFLMGILLISALATLCARVQNNGLENQASGSPSESLVQLQRMAREEWKRFSAALPGAQVSQTTLMAAPDGSGQVVVSFDYTYGGGSGQYGLLYQKEADGGFSLLQQGEDITIYTLLP